VLRIRRPHDYSPAAAKALGPTEPSSYINLALLRVVGGLVDEASAPRLSVSGLPKHLTDEQVGDPAGHGGKLIPCCAGGSQLLCCCVVGSCALSAACLV
jgi:splicing factor U2AF subunit